VDVVEKEDVNEAMRLMEMSKDSLVLGQEELKGRPQSTTDKIFAVIREMAQNAKTLKIADIKERYNRLKQLNLSIHEPIVG
jgi:DNA replication licensing factor MCM7